MLPTPDLPPIGELTELLAAALGADGSTSLSGGPYPSTALRFDDHHPVLVRTFHGGDARISLPRGTHVDVRLRASIDEDVRPILLGLGPLLAEPLLALTDVVVALQAPVLGLEPFTVDWPGVTVPDEAWVRSGRGSIGLFHRDELRAVVWVGGEMHELPLPDRSSLAELAAWAPPLLERQFAAGAAAATEQARLAALPRPTVDELWAHLRAGHELRLGGGRWSLRYWLRDGVLWRSTQDEGEVAEDAVVRPDEALAAAIEFDAVAVRRILEAAGG